MYFISIRLKSQLGYIKSYFIYRFIFGSFGARSLIINPIMISNPHCMYLGNRVLIRDGARLEVILGICSGPPILTIGDNVNIEQNAHIVCGHEIMIGNSVSITGNCAIIDVYHPYGDISDEKKIGSRLAVEKRGVHIGNNCFIGYGSIILPGARLGNYVVVGSNSVISGDIPDYSVVVGSPARVIKRYDENLKKWIKVGK